MLPCPNDVLGFDLGTRVDLTLYWYWWSLWHNHMISTSISKEIMPIERIHSSKTKF